MRYIIALSLAFWFFSIHAYADAPVADAACTLVDPPNPKITIVEFADFACPYCAMAEETIKHVLDDHPGQVRVVYRNILKHGAISLSAAKAFEAVCLQNPSAAYGYYTELYRNQNQLNDDLLIESAGKLNLDIPRMKADMEGAAVADRIEADKKIAGENQFTKTPSFLIGSQPVSGLYQAYSDFDNVVQAQLRAADVKSGTSP